jgi:hypothetical protein
MASCDASGIKMKGKDRCYKLLMDELIARWNGWFPEMRTLETDRLLWGVIMTRVILVSCLSSLDGLVRPRGHDIFEWENVVFTAREEYTAGRYQVILAKSSSRRNACTRTDMM